MDIENILEKCYEQAQCGLKLYRKMHNTKVLGVIEDVLIELARMSISWIVLTGNVAKLFIEVFILQGMLWWFSPLESPVARA
ncbi:MAG: hypothetical protein HQM12_14230 [SAR324 cluster bacterium]|nr:hypothetical protein [SAR324 cluster bacterium]